MAEAVIQFHSGGVKVQPPLSLYIHLPWCERKCPYCDFNSHEAKDIPEDDYVRALLHDLRHEQPLLQQRRVETLFIGGGTPSLFSASSIHRLLEGFAGGIILLLGLRLALDR